MSAGPDQFAPWGGVPGSGNCAMRKRSLEVTAEERERLELARRAADLGRALRQPGETLAEATAREAGDQGERRAAARKISATVHDPIDLRKVSPNFPKARKFEPLPPDIWVALKALAEEQGERPMELLPRVVERGLESFRRSV